MNTELLKELGFIGILNNLEQDIVLQYASYLLEQLASGMYGEPLEDNESINFFSEKDAKLPLEVELKNIYSSIRKNKHIELAMVPAMLLTTIKSKNSKVKSESEQDDLNKLKYESIKAWSLLACISIFLEQGKTRTLNEGARRVRLLQKNRYNWLLNDLPIFDSSLPNVMNDLENLKKEYQKTAQNDKKLLYLGQIYNLFNEYLVLKHPQLKIHNDRDLEGLDITGIAVSDSDFSFNEYIDKPKRDVITINERELVGDQHIDHKYIQLEIKRKKRETDLLMRMRQATAMVNRLSMRQMQFLSDTSTLTFYEVKIVLIEIWEQAVTGSSAHIMVILILLLGRKDKRIINWILEENKFNDTFEVENGCILLKYNPNLPEHNIEGNAAQLIVGTKNECILSLPNDLTQSVLKLKEDVNKAQYDELDVAVSRLLSSINKKYSISITKVKLSTDLLRV